MNKKIYILFLFLSWCFLQSSGVLGTVNVSEGILEMNNTVWNHNAQQICELYCENCQVLHNLCLFA